MSLPDPASLLWPRSYPQDTDKWTHAGHISRCVVTVDAAVVAGKGWDDGRIAKTVGLTRHGVGLARARIAEGGWVASRD
jgi:hypothetical protein